MTLQERASKIGERFHVPHDDAIWLAYYRVQNMEYQRNARLNKRIELICYRENAVFITLTIKDSYLESLSFETLQRYAQEWARKNLHWFVGNADYGDENGRLHFHLVGNYKELLASSSWKYGAVNFQRITQKNPRRLRLYILKLRNHAIKETASKIFRSKEK